MRILVFIVFLVVYAGFMWVASALSTHTTRAMLVNKTFWNTQLTIFLGFGMLFTFVFVLSGYFNARLLAALFGASQIGVLLAAILGGLLGSATSKWGAHGQWAGGEFGIKHVPLTLGLMVLTMLIFIAYPVLAGISYFGLPAGDLPVRIFQYTLCVLFLGGYPVLLLILIGVLVSENLDEETRTRFLVNQLASLVPNALWVALLLWSFGIMGAGQDLTIGSVSLALSPLVIAVLISFFLLTVLIPYLIGAQRAKQWRTTLLKKRQSWMEKLEDVLETPAGSLYLPKLFTLQQSIDQEIEEFVASDPMIAYSIQIDQGVIPPTVKAIAPAYQLARDLDPRFKHLDSLRLISGKISEIRADLGKLATEQALEKAAKDWTKYLHPRKEELSKELSLTKKTNTPALLILSGVIVPIFSVVLSEFAKWLWGYFSKSLAQ
jgi:hypothetical protein